MSLVLLVIYSAVSLICNAAPAVYRNTVYAPPKLGKTIPTWIFSQWGTEDPSFKPPHSRSVSLPLYGSVHMTAYWFADVNIGTPHPQKQSLIADTGSSVMGFPCADCESCGNHADPAFDIHKTKSAKALGCAGACPLCAIPRGNSFNQEGQCAYHIRYTEGSSLVGKWFTDKVWLDRDPFSTTSQDGALFELPFGCHTEETHLFVSQEASGILGLEGTSRFGPPPFVTAVLADLQGMTRGRSGGISRNLQITGRPRTRETKPVVSLCLSASGGILTIGDVNLRYHVKKSSVEDLFSFFEVSGHVEDSRDCEALGTCRGPRRPEPPRRPTLPSHTGGSSSTAWSSYGNEPSYAAEGRSNGFSGAVHYPQSGGRYLMECATEDFGAPDRRLEAEESFAIETVLRSPPQHYEPLSRGLVWTPLAMDQEEEGGWPGSYVAVIQQAYVKGAAGHMAVAVPFSSRPIAVRTGTVNGLPALVDSGTTLTYLPFMLYANLWTALLRNIVAEKENHGEGRRLSKSSGIVRVSGTTMDTMSKRLLDYSNELRQAERLLMTRRMSIDNSAGENSEANKERLNEIRRQLISAERTRGELKLLMAQQEEQGPSLIDAGLWQDLATIEVDESATPRALPERGRNQPDRMDPVIFPDSHKLSLESRRRLFPVSLPNLDEECWYFANIEEDVKHFPDIKFVFANGAEYIWRPSSFLYRKGKTRVFCLTIIADKSDDNRRLTAVRPDFGQREYYAEEGSAAARRLGETKQAVLGSSFFIDHDLVFHLGNWGLGFAEARCPVTDLRKRLNRKL